MSTIVDQIDTLVGAADAPTRVLTVLYDEMCPFCIRCSEWLGSQPCLVDVEILGVHSLLAAARYGDISLPPDELVVFDDHGRMWEGSSAFLVCLWATARYRTLAASWSEPGKIGAARHFFEAVSRNRGRLSGLMTGTKECDMCAASPEGVTHDHL